MSMLLINNNQEPNRLVAAQDDSRYNRNINEDIKTVIDLLIELNEKINFLHPYAAQVAQKLVSY